MTAPDRFTSMDINALTRRAIAEDAANQNRKAASVKRHNGDVDDMLLRSIWADEPSPRVLWGVYGLAAIIGVMIGAVLVGYYGSQVWAWLLL